MSAFRPSLRLLAAQRLGQTSSATAAAQAAAPAARRQASSAATMPHSYTPPQYSLKVRSLSSLSLYRPILELD